MYTKTLKSETVIPQVNAGHYTLDELILKNVSVYAYSSVVTKIAFLYNFQKLTLKNASCRAKKIFETETRLVKEIARNRGDSSLRRTAEIIDKNSIAILFDTDRLKLYTEVFQKVLHKHVYITEEQSFACLISGT